MEKPKRTYKNAGAQSQQGRREAHVLYWDAPDSDLFTVTCISIVLSIRLQMVKQIPVQRIMIDKRGYYRKGDIRAWMEADLARPDSLLKKLQAEHAKSMARMRTQPSREYRPGQIGAKEAKAAHEKTHNTKGSGPNDSYEANLIARKSGAFDVPNKKVSRGGRSAIAAADLIKLWVASPTRSKKV